MDIPDAQETNPTYENLAAKCPSCGKWSIFNRASDLGTFEPIDTYTATCQNPKCGKLFNISGDAINPAHEMLLVDCRDLIGQKHYRQCLLNLAQAYEVFFYLFLRVELLYRPFAADSVGDMDRLDALKEKLYQKVKRHTFVTMRSLFLQQVLSGARPRTLDEAETAIDALPERPPEPDYSEISAVANIFVGDVSLADLLRVLKATKINELRNHVVHKDAYQPTRDEVESALEEAENILFLLSNHFDLYERRLLYIGKIPRWLSSCYPQRKDRCVECRCILYPCRLTDSAIHSERRRGFKWILKK